MVCFGAAAAGRAQADDRPAAGLEAVDPPLTDNQVMLGDGPTRRARLYWDDGLNYEVPRRLALPERELRERVRDALGQPLPPYRLAGKIRLTFQGDAAMFRESPDLPLIADGIEVRRFVLATSGELVFGLPIQYAVELELAKDRFFLTELALGMRGLPWIGSLSIGQFKPYVTLDSATPARSLTFMERAAAVQAFAPEEKAGIQIGNQALEGRLTWKLGWFADSTATDSGDATESPTRVVGRLTWLPVADDASRRLVHLGISGSYIFSSRDEVRYRTRPESHLAPYLADTGPIKADNAYVVALEAALVSGPLSLQGEYLQSVVQEVSGPPLQFRGFYLFASWFLTGESRPYDRARGAFGWLTPRRSVGFHDGGLGAWEVAVRYSYLDLDDGAVGGGRMGLTTLALNWYLTRNVRLSANYVATDVMGSGGGWLHALQGRVQLAF
jgi:phosphate-selective porin OprO and OprP